MLCYHCNGEGCKECTRGWVFYEVSPGISIEYSDLFRVYAWFKNYGLLPCSGTWLDQTAYFLHLIEYCDGVAVIWKRKLEEQKERNEEFVKRAKGGR